jgi:hypothetical protein
VPDAEDAASTQTTSSVSETPAGVMSAAVANQKAGMGKEAKKINKRLRAVSRALAKALAEEELRQYVYGRAMEKFDGETNVLWSHLESPEQGKSAPGGKSWNTLIKDALPPGKARGMAHKLENTIDRAGRLLGGSVHLYWALAENFDGSEAPLVTFTPVGVDADEIDEIVAFDADGNEHVVDEESIKTQPVVVLTSNERVGDEGASSGSNDTVETNYVTDPCEDMDCDTNKGGGTIGDDYHQYPGHMALDYIRMYDAYEGWPNGGPEFHMTLTQYDADVESPASLGGVRLWPQYDIDRSDCDGDKIYLNKVIGDWNPENYPSYSIQWVERDSDDWLYKYWIYDVPFDLPAWAEAPKAIVDHFIKKGSGDDMLEHAVTNHTDSPKYYGTGAPDFKLTLIPE